jgi:SAP domain-containing new25
MIRRPELSIGLPAKEFAAWYWLKEELVAFCRMNGVSPSGTKLELVERIKTFLEGKPVRAKTSIMRRLGAMPPDFTLDTVIGEGWRCNPHLGAFLREATDGSFRFNAEVRKLIHHGHGKSLADVVACYRKSVLPGRKKAAIPTQLEYNQHFQDYFQANPGATREQAIAAWWTTRGQRKRVDLDDSDS